jgi:hypothetical protein
MPIPSPKKKQSKNDFISSCMSDLSTEFPDQKQRAAVCYGKWDDKKSKASVITDEGKDSETIY